MANVPGNVEDAVYELQERMGRLLPSQMEFMSAPEPQEVIAGGWGSGKTHVANAKGLVLSAVFPHNRGMVARFHSTDLEDSTIPVFFDVCPPSWVRSYRKQGPGRATVTLKNGSEILFRHLHDAKAATKSRRVGANLGWALVDQLEECEIGHWNTLVGRLRLPAAKKKFLLATINPAGHDWIYKLFFEGMEPTHTLPKGVYYRVKRQGNRLGIAVNSQENRISNGGFVDDGYFDEIINSMDPAWVARYVYCSFEDFAGKVYREYTLNSVHNIKPFSVPSHWPAVIGIDVGGDAPWHIGDHRFDEAGNDIVVNEFHKPSVNTAEVANWIKANTPWNKSDTMFVIDWENKLAMLELAEHGIHCQPAIKKVHPGILRMGGYLHVQEGAALPSWYYQTQPKLVVEKFKDKGAPRSFVFESCMNTRRERDRYIWDPNRVNVPKKENDHSCDEDRYVLMYRPESAKLPKVDKLATLRAADPQAAREWDSYDRRVQARMNKRAGAGQLREADLDTVDNGPADSSEGPSKNTAPDFVRATSFEVEG